MAEILVLHDNLADGSGGYGYRKEASLIIPELRGPGATPFSEARVCLAQAQKTKLQHGGVNGDQRILLEPREMDALCAWWGRVKKLRSEL